MFLFTESSRLDMLKAIGAEEFNTGHVSMLWAVFEGEFNDPELSGVPVEGQQTWIECRISDKDAHKLVKGSRLTRISTGQDYFVRRFEPSESSGFLVVRLGK